MTYTEVRTGRRFLGQLPRNKDLIRSVESFCRDTSVQMAVFSMTGSVSSFTIGTYDQKQQVYVTFTEKTPREAVACSGNIFLKDGNPVVSAHVVLADDQGVITGGRLFSDTIIFAGEIDLQELTGPPLKRVYDPSTGLWLWKPAT